MKNTYLLLLAACTAREIVFKPAAQIDPLPATEAVATAGVDPLASAQWNLRKIGLDAAALATAGGSATLTIAVLSTGVDYNHEDLVGRIAINQQELAAALPTLT